MCFQRLNLVVQDAMQKTLVTSKGTGDREVSLIRVDQLDQLTKPPDSVNP